MPSLMEASTIRCVDEYTILYSRKHKQSPGEHCIDVQNPK